VTTIDANGTPSGIGATVGGTVTIEGLTITDIGSFGVGISVDGPDTTIRDVAVRDYNSAATNGGILLVNGETTVIRSSVTGVRATTALTSAAGGGITVGASAAATISETTVANNFAGADDTSQGGGIAVFGNATLRHVTMFGNEAQSGGNLYVAGTASLSDSIVGPGTAFPAPNFGPSCRRTGTLTVSGRNIFNGGDGGCVFPAGTVAASTAALSPLGSYGGGTRSAPPVIGSTALNAAGACPASGRDQRGAAAPAGAACDIGASELGADLQITLTPTRQSASTGDQVTYVAQVVNRGVDASSATFVAVAGNGLPVLTTSSKGSCAAGGCNIGTLARGESAQVTAVVAAPDADRLTTIARAASATPDPSPANATATSSIAIGGVPRITGFGARGKLIAGKGGTLKATLSKAATVKVTVARLTKGRRSRGRCRAKTKKGKRCTIAKKVGTVTARRSAGAVSIKLPGKFGRRKLAAGRYRLTAVATDSSGNRSRPATATVRVRKAAKRRR
jgi:hypothetical protein